jgi:hypothetical protein
MTPSHAVNAHAVNAHAVNAHEVNANSPAIGVSDTVTVAAIASDTVIVGYVSHGKI